MRRAPANSPGPPSPQDVEVYRRLIQLAALGESRRSWDAATIVRVAEAFLPHPKILRRQLAKTQAEVEAKEETVKELRRRCNHLRARVQHLETLINTHEVRIEPHEGPPLRTVYLSPAHMQLLEMIKLGMTTRGISEKLGISFSAASNRIWRVYNLLGVHSRAEAVSAVESGAIDVKGK